MICVEHKWKQVNIRHLIIPDMSDKLQEELGIVAKPGCVITWDNMAWGQLVIWAHPFLGYTLQQLHQHGDRGKSIKEENHCSYGHILG